VCFQIDPNGVLTRIAGTSRCGYEGDGGPALTAQLHDPLGIAIDRNGNIFIADLNNQHIRKVSTSGIITTVAGTGTIGRSGDGGQPTDSRLNNPRGVAVDGSGNLYLAENSRIRKIYVDGRITTVAGSETLEARLRFQFGQRMPPCRRQPNNSPYKSSRL
jgi:hypothetical protein